MNFSTNPGFAGISCHTCNWWGAPADYNRLAPLESAPVDMQYRCEYNPPQASILIGQGMTGPQPMPVTFWPTNSANGRCHCWQNALPAKTLEFSKKV